jgi:hypothetical protein
MRLWLVGEVDRRRVVLAGLALVLILPVLLVASHNFTTSLIGSPGGDDPNWAVARLKDDILKLEAGEDVQAVREHARGFPTLAVAIEIFLKSYEEAGKTRPARDMPDRELADQLRLVEAVALALDLGAWVVMDERPGRSYAEALGMKLTGTLGIIRRLHRQLVHRGSDTPTIHATSTLP